MRYIVLSLPALNCIYLFYNLFGEEAATGYGTPIKLPKNVSSIQLLREGTNQDIRQRQMDRVVKNPVLLPEALTLGCKAVGPFTSVTLAQSALERVESLDYLVELRAFDQLTGEHDYRGMMPPAASLEGAFRQLRELQSRGIDSYVITQGKDTLGISLGVYSLTAAAEAVQQEMGEKGYATLVAKIARLEREYWIFSKENSDLDLEYGTLELLQQGVLDILQPLQMCLNGASV